MKKICCWLVAVAACSQGAWSAEPLRTRKPLDRPISLGELAPTPEMWFYEQQMREHNDPQAAVRRKAEFKADQRLRRIESLKWFGYSNARPTTTPDFQFGPASPQWSSNSGNPMLWRGISRPTVILENYSPGYGFR
ncbi:MAG: hypothetical protein AB7O62_23465 [Pirellulales bacterium]